MAIVTSTVDDVPTQCAPIHAGMPLRCNTTGIVAPAKIATKAAKLKTDNTVSVRTLRLRVLVANMCYAN